MKELNRKIVSLALAASLAGSVAPTMVNAQGYDDDAQITNYYANNEEAIKIYRLNGVYTTLILNEPVYVYLGNNVRNEILLKNDALILMGEVYKNTYLMEKTILNQAYVEGVSHPSERFTKVYAVSDKSEVTGWKNVKKSSVSPDTMVYTTIELAEFLTNGKFDELVEKRINFNNNMKGFVKADINNDGALNELLYLGNNKDNMVMEKADAIRYAKANNLYYQKRSLPNIKNAYGKEVVAYSLSDKAYVPGWTRISKDDLPKNVKISSNTEYAEAIYFIQYNQKSLVEEVVYVEVSRPELPYSSMLKDQALEYAYNNYPDFCIMMKALSEGEVIYAFSEAAQIDYWAMQGWNIIGNDYISKDTSIFLSMNDACNYEASLNNDYSRRLLP